MVSKPCFGLHALQLTEYMEDECAPERFPILELPGIELDSDGIGNVSLNLTLDRLHQRGFACTPWTVNANHGSSRILVAPEQGYKTARHGFEIKTRRL